MANIQIAIINASTVLSDDEVSKAVPALQRQVHEHFAPAWGIDADLAFFSQNQSPPPGSWWLVVLDNSDVAGALGYHDTTSEGLPIGKVFAGSDLQFGLKWTVTASHELLEMLGDPEINLTVFVQPDAGSGTLYAYEVCDACEADRFGYDIDGVTVSDFVFPAWFEASRPAGSTRFDQAGKLTRPLPFLLPGGYIGAFDVTTGTGWHQITADTITGRAASRARVGSRRERRRTPRNHWQRSEGKPHQLKAAS
jgi:hypothetical protein